jgi:mono/diheme cytochrome c family protein
MNKTSCRKYIIFLPAVAACAALTITSAFCADDLASTHSIVDTKMQIGERVFHEACSQCHGPGEILIQRKPEDSWRRTVYSMISRGAFVSAEEIDPLVAYLKVNCGPDSQTSVGGNAIHTLPEGRGKEILIRTCSACHPVSAVTQVRKSKSAWQETLERMVRGGAIVTPSEQDELLDYITTKLQSAGDFPSQR